MPQTILLADDEADILGVLRVRLTAAGYTVITATDGEEAVAMARKHRPALAILDYKMPKLEGPQVCKAFRADPQLQSIPVILVTASSYKLTEQLVGEVAANDFLIKPFESSALLEKVRRLLAAA